MSFLEETIARKRIEVAERRAQVPELELRRRASNQTGVRSLYGALSLRGGPMRIIAEVKRSSPSVGRIGAIPDAGVLAKSYAAAGAAAVSVLTDGQSFGGSLDDLVRVRAETAVPLLRKDFIIDEYQLLEARSAGADAVLLIVAALSFARLTELYRAARQLGLECLVEVHDRQELDAVLDADAQIIGVNNRDLGSLQVDLATSERLIPLIEAPRKAVAESGISGLPQAQSLRAAGAANLLIGEALVRAADPGKLIKSISAI